MSGLRLLVCVDGSRAAIQAARLALQLVADHGGEVLAVSVLTETETARRIDARGRPGRPARERIARSARAVLDRVAAMAADDGVTVATELVEGDPLRTILARSRDWRPDMLLIGRTGRSGPGSPVLGSLALTVVEFADRPVVVVPET
jgi:nucleotide-binding universal stress UspA family protein